jgi:hypothetical protein
VAPREAVQEIAVFLESDVERRHVENDGPGDKESRRAGKPAIERRKPFVERLNRLEDVCVGMVYELLRTRTASAVCRWK